MSLFSNFVRKKPRQAQPMASEPCAHRELAPRWDSVADMGIMERVTYYACTNCGEQLTPEQVRTR